MEASRKAHERTVVALVGGLALVLALAGLLGWSISRSISGSVGEALRTAKDVAAGKLDGKIDTSRTDEVGQLLSAMQRMQRQVVALIAALAEMTRRHDEGNISFRIDDSGFPGDYGRMVRDTNTLVAQHIGVKMRAVDVMRRYAVGDLSMTMDRLPGEKGRHHRRRWTCARPTCRRSTVDHAWPPPPPRATSPTAAISTSTSTISATWSKASTA